MATLHRLRPLASIPTATTPRIFVRTAIAAATALKPQEPVVGKQSKGRLLPERQVRPGLSTGKEIIKSKKDGDAVKDIVIFMDKEAKTEYRKAEQARKGTKPLTMRQGYNKKYPRAIPPVPEGHGKEIFIFAHIQTGRVIYSFTRVMDVCISSTVFLSFLQHIFQTLLYSYGKAPLTVNRVTVTQGNETVDVRR